jgi:hypothetical protein
MSSSGHSCHRGQWSVGLSAAVGRAVTTAYPLSPLARQRLTGVFNGNRNNHQLSRSDDTERHMLWDRAFCQGPGSTLASSYRSSH